MSCYLARLSERRYPEPYEPYLALVAIEFSGGDESWVDYLTRKPYLGELGFVVCADEEELEAFCAAHPEYALRVEPCGNLYGLLLGRAQLPDWMTAALLQRDVDTSFVGDIGKAWSLPAGVASLHTKDHAPLFSRLLDLGFSVDEAITAFVSLGFISEGTFDDVHIPGVEDRTSMLSRRTAFDYRSTILLALMDEPFMDNGRAAALIAREAETSYALAMMFAAVSVGCFCEPVYWSAPGGSMPALAAAVARQLGHIYPLPEEEALFAFDAIAGGYLELEEVSSFAPVMAVCMDTVANGVPAEDVFA